VTKKRKSASADLLDTEGMPDDQMLGLLFGVVMLWALDSCGVVKWKEPHPEGNPPPPHQPPPSEPQAQP
jgi:hypothetical protein